MWNSLTIYIRRQPPTFCHRAITIGFYNWGIYRTMASSMPFGGPTDRTLMLRQMKLRHFVHASRIGICTISYLHIVSSCGRVRMKKCVMAYITFIITNGGEAWSMRFYMNVSENAKYPVCAVVLIVLLWWCIWRLTKGTIYIYMSYIYIYIYIYNSMNNPLESPTLIETSFVLFPFTNAIIASALSNVFSLVFPMAHSYIDIYLYLSHWKPAFTWRELYVFFVTSRQSCNETYTQNSCYWQRRIYVRSIYIYIWICFVFLFFWQNPRFRILSRRLDEPSWCEPSNVANHAWFIWSKIGSFMASFEHPKSMRQSTSCHFCSFAIANCAHRPSRPSRISCLQPCALVHFYQATKWSSNSSFVSHVISRAVIMR